MTNRGPKSVMSASHHTMRSPSAAATDFQSASPLPSPGPSSGSTSSTATTRAPAAAATSAVRSVEWSSITRTSSTRPDPVDQRRRRMVSTIGADGGGLVAGRQAHGHDVAVARLALGELLGGEVLVVEGPDHGPPHGVMHTGRATHRSTTRGPGSPMSARPERP